MSGGDSQCTSVQVQVRADNLTHMPAIIATNRRKGSEKMAPSPNMANLVSSDILSMHSAYPLSHTDTFEF